MLQRNGLKISDAPHVNISFNCTENAWPEIKCKPLIPLPHNLYRYIYDVIMNKMVPRVYPMMKVQRKTLP